MKIGIKHLCLLGTCLFLLSCQPTTDCQWNEKIELLLPQRTVSLHDGRGEIVVEIRANANVNLFIEGIADNFGVATQGNERFNPDHIRNEYNSFMNLDSGESVRFVIPVNYNRSESILLIGGSVIGVSPSDDYRSRVSFVPSNLCLLDSGDKLYTDYFEIQLD